MPDDGISKALTSALRRRLSMPIEYGHDAQVAALGKSGLRKTRPNRTIVEQALDPILIFAAVVGAAVAALIIQSDLATGLTFMFLIKQDSWLTLAGVLILLLSLFRLSATRVLPRLGVRTALILAVGVMIAVWVGRQEVLLDYDMSRDEQMASFDAAIFSTGHLVAPLGDPWSKHASVLNISFMLPVTDRMAWVSGYLPMNAAIRGLFGSVGAADLVGPLAVLLGGVALWACARKIWPADRPAAVLALVLYLGSGQVLVNGMTSYAMPLHLTANLVWLWLFLQNRLRTDGLALCVGFVAVGLHQPVFHPMFALPILLGVVIERDWRRSAFYLVGYLVIGAFWLWWPNFSAGLTGTALPHGEAGFLSRLTRELFHGQERHALDMVANLIRFLTWQHLVLLPLMVIGVRSMARDRLMLGLAGGIVLTIVVMTIILPYQGHGFGYRYLHGLVGNAILLAVLGWQRVRDEFPQWNDLIVRTTAGGLLIVLPLQLYLAHAFYAPFAQASRAIDRSDADYVLIKGTGAAFAQDLVINDPYLAKRPIRLFEEFTDAATFEDLCRDGATIARLPAPYYDRIRRYFAGPGAAPVSLDNEELTSIVQKSGCKLW